MKRFKHFKKAMRGSLISWLLLSSLFTIVLMSLIRPVGSSDWWNPNWAFRKEITINHTMVNATLENFPVLIDIVDPDLKYKAQLDGDDIVFVGVNVANNCTLNHEIEWFDSQTGHLVAWVNIPFLSSTEDTVLRMYYGNPEASNMQNASLVWVSNFTMVQHLEEKSTARYDSTKNGNNGTTYGGLVKSETGKIDGADELNGVNSYVTIPDNPTLDLTGPITIEAWIRSSQGLTSQPNAWYGGLGKTYAYELGWQGWTDGWTFQIYNSGTRIYLDSKNVYMPKDEWHYVVGQYDGQFLKIYLDGNLVATKDIGSKTIDVNTNALQIGICRSGAYWNGTIDEVRISNVSRSAEWIRTCYNNQNDPAKFFSLGSEETYEGAYTPLILDVEPINEATDIYTNPTLSIRVAEPNKQNMTIVFEQKASNAWEEIAKFDNRPDGTYSVIPTKMDKLGTTYYWRVAVTDGENWANETLSFTTTTTILKQKWVATNVPPSASGVLISDINGDGAEEVFHAGKGGVVALNGKEGSILWRYPDDRVGFMAQAQMADLDKDGIPELVVPLEKPAGLLVLHANNGTLYWNITGLGLETYSSPVIADIDGDGYPTIFIASTDIYKGLNGTGRISAISHNGTILYQTFSWRPCGGGLSIADADGDGEFELYMGERHMYENNPEYGDNDYGKGVQSYWAKNLTLRWFQSDIACSSHIPMLADVNGDGILEVIVGHLDGGLAVLNSTDGSVIKKTLGIPDRAPVHYQPSVYDIDGDGNLEMLMADPHDETSDDLVVWDLVKWKEDARIYIGKNFYGPQVADVTGDGIMEIVACNYKSIIIIDKNYQIIGGVVGLSGDIIQSGQPQFIDGIVNIAGVLNYAVVQDIDGDNYSELVVSTQSGAIYAFDTPARTPNPRPRTEVQFYSEYRRGVAEYVPPPGCPQPVIFSPNPPNGAKEVSMSLSRLQFTVTDYQKDRMNITVTTNPNIGYITLDNQGNGRYTIDISNLRYSTTYTWTITATDGTYWTNVTYTFTTQTFHPWWNSTWQYRKLTIINHNKVASDQTNFPILIDITDSDLSSKAQNDGDDIIFTDINGNKLAHEIELYDNSTGHLITWVRIPWLSSTEDTILYIYYGNPEASNMQKPTEVWDSNFVAVQHFEEASDTRFDSTSNGNNATIYGTVNKASTGKINGADTFNGSGYEKVEGGFLPTSAITLELWLKPLSYSTSSWTKFLNTGPRTTRGIVGGQASLSSDLWEIILTWDDGTNVFRTGGKPTNYDWTYFALTWNGTHATAYYNGIKIKEEAVSGIPDWANKPLYLGSNYNGGERFNGTIDELRISNIARSQTWIQTIYSNQKDPTQFYTIGYEETIPEFPVVYAPSPPNNAINVSLSLTEITFNLTDYQGDLMNCTVTTYPNIGSASDINVQSGKISVPVSGLQYFTTYTWTISVTDGNHWTNITYTFTTLPSEPPTHDDPILVKSDGNIICYNQSTTDPDGDKVTNIYNWCRNGISTTNLLMPFDTNTTTMIKDYSGYNNHGTIIGDVRWTPNGIVGGAYNFNRGYIQIQGTNTLDGGGTWSEITVEVWIKITAFPTSGANTRIIARIPSYEIGITSGKQLFASIWTATGNPMTSGHNMITYNTTTLNLNTWYHIVLTYKKGVAMTLYVNGTAVATKTPSESATLNYNIQTSGTNPLYIGWFDYFKGTIDEARIYPKSLTPQQIYQRYIETKDGLSNSSTIVYAELQTGETWQCKVTPNDSHQDGTTKTSNTIIIGQNNKPSAKNLAITPTTPKTNDTLTGSYTFFDPDGDLENITLTEIRWYRNGTLVPELNNTLTVPSTYTTKGEIWNFTVRPSDGSEYGIIYESPRVLIQNSPPEIIYIAMTPDPAYTNSTLSVDLIALDADGDNITYIYQWQKYNATDLKWYDIPEATNETLGPENFNKTDQLKIICTPYDGQDHGAPQEATITILNAPPEITSYFPTTNPTINLGESQEFNITLTDIDGDTLTIEWYVNYTLQTLWTGNLSVIFQPDQVGTYAINVVVFDGENENTHQWTLIVKEP